MDILRNALDGPVDIHIDENTPRESLKKCLTNTISHYFDYHNDHETFFDSKEMTKRILKILTFYNIKVDYKVCERCNDKFLGEHCSCT